MPLPPSWIMSALAVAGVGLGIFAPANNAVIMAGGGAGSAAVLGGLASMARGIGTILGIALLTLTLQLAGPDPAGRPDATAAVEMLAAAAALAALIAAAIRPPGSGRQPPETGSARAPG